MNKLLIRVVLFSIFLFFIHTCSYVYTADVLYRRSQDKLVKGKVSGALEDINLAISRNSNEPNYYKERAKVYIYSTIGEDDSTQKAIKTKALTDLQTALAINPQNLVTIRNLVPLYFFLATKDLSKPSTPDNIDEKYVKAASDYFAFVQTYSPNDAGVYTLLAKYEKRLNLMDEYNFAKDRVTTLRPDLLEWNDAFRN